jgi:hypothetical protein
MTTAYAGGSFNTKIRTYTGHPNRHSQSVAKLNPGARPRPRLSMSRKRDIP